MDILLVPVFTVHGFVTNVNGFYPIEQPSMEQCLERKEMLEEQATYMDFPIGVEFVRADCIEKE